MIDEQQREAIAAARARGVKLRANVVVAALELAKVRWKCTVSMAINPSVERRATPRKE